MAVIDIKKTDFSIVDGTTPTPNEVTVKVGDGNLTYSEKKPREYIKNKGLLDAVRDADEEPMEVSFQFQWIFVVSDSDGPTIEEALKQTGDADEWASSAADPCEPYAVDVVVDYDPDCSAVKGEKYVFPDFRYESLEHDFRAGTISAQGMCNATQPIVTRHT